MPKKLEKKFTMGITLAGVIHIKGLSMPKKLEKKLKTEATKKGLKGEKADAYVYGTLRKTGWKPKKETKSPK
jgi:hypothetical protein